MKIVPVLLSVFALLFVGCGKPNLDDPDSLNQILETALEYDDLQERGKEGEVLYYKINSQKPYTGWIKEMAANGQVLHLEQYKDGRRHGLEAWWYTNTQIRSVYESKNGVDHGDGTSWYSNGQKATEDKYKNGDIVWASSWLPNGSKCPLTNLKDGNGVVVEYHENGQKRRESNYVDGKFHGLLTEWDEGGQKIGEYNYKDGVMVE